MDGGPPSLFNRCKHKRTIPQDIVTKWIFEEKVKRIGNSIPVDKKVYSNPDSILRILTDMVNITSLTFFEAGKTYIALSLKRVQYVKDCLFELEVQIPNIMRKKTIAVPIKDICLEGNKSFVIHMNSYPVDVTLGKKPKISIQFHIPVFTPIKKGRRTAVHGGTAPL